jgi:tetratricopeptide (TPR) repeat protein
MRFISSLIIIIWIFTLSGCAYLNSFSSKLPDEIELLTQEKQYGEALDILAYIKPTNPDYVILMKQKEKLTIIVSNLEQKTLKDSRKYLAQKKWLKTQHTLETTLVKIPDSESVNKEYERFIIKRDRHLKNIEIALVQNKAHWLIENTSVKQSIERILPDAEDKYSELKDFRRQINRISDKLVDCVEFSLKQKNWTQANQCYELVRKLDPDAFSKKQNKEILSQLLSAHHQNENAINDKTKKLIVELKQGFSHENLMRAHQHLVLINKQEKASRKMKKLAKKLNKKYRQRIKEGIDAGRKLYSNGKIEEALKVWNALLIIDSQNEKLSEHINRANRVVENLARISESNNKVTPP